MITKMPKHKNRTHRKTLETASIKMEADNVNMPFQDPSIAYNQFDLPPSEEDRKRAHEINTRIRSIKPSKSSKLTKDILLRLSSKYSSMYECDSIDISSNEFDDVISDEFDLFHKLKYIDAGNNKLVRCKHYYKAKCTNIYFIHDLRMSLTSLSSTSYHFLH